MLLYLGPGQLGGPLSRVGWPPLGGVWCLYPVPRHDFGYDSASLASVGFSLLSKLNFLVFLIIPQI